jgi:glucose/arabinose dehydrogenase
VRRGWRPTTLDAYGPRDPRAQIVDEQVVPVNITPLCRDGDAIAGGNQRVREVLLVPVVSSGISNPTSVGNAGDGSNRLFIVERDGIIRVLQPGSSTPTVFLDIRTKVVSGGEQGLLGLAFHPLYASNGRFFVYYTRAGDGTLVLAEYKVSTSNRDIADPTEKVLLTIPHPTFTNHNGGMLAFRPDNSLKAMILPTYGCF